MSKHRPFDFGHERMTFTDAELSEEIELLEAADKALTALGNRYSVVLFDIRIKLHERRSYEHARSAR